MLSAALMILGDGGGGVVVVDQSVDLRRHHLLIKDGMGKASASGRRCESTSQSSERCVPNVRSLPHLSPLPIRILSLAPQIDSYPPLHRFGQQPQPGADATGNPAAGGPGGY